jgi:glycogen phosphorylase
MSYERQWTGTAVREALDALAYNLWWSWDTQACALWPEIDAFRWERDRHNPVTLLRDVEPARWAALAADPSFVSRVEAVLIRFQAYLTQTNGSVASPSVAYFSMEFGLHESLRLYSGGLGVLAGDHLRSASDLGLPMVGVSLLYRRGYFRQVIDGTEQLAAYPEADVDRLPLRLVVDADGAPITVEVPVAERGVTARIWRLDVGRCPLFLLDTGCDLTHQLYGGDSWMRIRQEVLLGLGGVRVLEALGRSVDVYHLNEGHCAFACLQLAADAYVAGSPWPEALRSIGQRCVFTTHTPVPAGHDRFGWEHANRALGPWRASLGLPEGAFMDLGRETPSDLDEPLCMTVLALRLCRSTNGVSRLHGEVSRQMWGSLGSEIGSVTNGVHPVFWSSQATRQLFDETVSGWREAPWDPAIWAPFDRVSSSRIAAWRLENRRCLLDRVERSTGVALDPERLTVGFARRFAAYKRGDLLFSDPDRLRAILGDAQVIFAGKAHPRDQAGREILEAIVRWTHHRDFRGRVVFVEDYDIALGRVLTAGADVWLNTPRRPREASGTSGQKVILNGGLNLSILDGWWPEGFDGTHGWAIDDGRAWSDTDAQDAHDAARLYEILESEVLPCFGTEAWNARIRRSVTGCAPLFTSHRMVRDYALEIYAEESARAGD